ncbi:MAG: hypothetical protein AB1726_03245 [Planctomycetota bacterium]
MTLPEPYSFVRLVTMSLAAIWTVAGLVRLLRFGRRWERRLRAAGFSRRWLGRQILLAAARATVLDPINLALLCLLFALWSNTVP